MAKTTAFDLTHEIPESGVVNFFDVSIGNDEIMGPLLDYGNVRIWFDTGSMWDDFGIYFQWGARGATFERLLRLSTNWKE